MATDTMRRTAGSPRQAPGRARPKDPAPKNPARTRPRTRPVTAPRHTRPVTGPVKARSRPAAARTADPLAADAVHPAARRAARRRPGLLLVISTTLAQGAFRITNLQEQNANLARQEQTLTNEVAQAGNPAVIAAEAKQLGMRPNPRLGFIDLKTGKIVTGKPSSAEAAINVPGYTP